MQYSESQRTFSLAHPTTQVQQKTCPHSVTALAVRSSRHKAHLRLARTSEGKESTSNTVRSPQKSFPSSPSEAAAVTRLRGTNELIVVESMYVFLSISPPPCVVASRDNEEEPSTGGNRVEDDLEWRRGAMRDCIRYASLMTSRIPSSEYEGGFWLGLGGTEDT